MKYTYLCDPGKPMHKLKEIKKDIPESDGVENVDDDDGDGGGDGYDNDE